MKVRGWRRWLLSPLVLVACSITGTDLSPARGAYDLELVDGSPLPVAIEAGSCPLEVYTGELGLTPTISRRRPLFTLFVDVRLQCDPTRILPMDVSPFVRDFGEWTIVDDGVQLRSEEGYGNQIVPMEDPSPGMMGPLLTIERGGRRYTFRRTRIGPL
jgi:hypothetical protein